MRRSEEKMLNATYHGKITKEREMKNDYQRRITEEKKQTWQGGAGRRENFGGRQKIWLKKGPGSGCPLAT